MQKIGEGMCVASTVGVVLCHSSARPSPRLQFAGALWSVVPMFVDSAGTAVECLDVFGFAGFRERGLVELHE